MATPRLFKLKAQVAPTLVGAVAAEMPYARVWVDTGVFHLDEAFDYQVTEKLSSLVRTGIRVQVPFGSREVEGIVIARNAQPESSAKIKPITKVLSPHCVATTASLQLIEQVAKRWAGNPWDIIRSAIPPRIAAVDKTHVQTEQEMVIKQVTGKISYHAFEPHVDPALSVAKLAIDALSQGSVLLVAPDERDIRAIVDSLDSVRSQLLRIDSGASRSDRYSSFLRTLSGGNHIVIGARNAVFAPMPAGSTVIVFKESSPDLYEIRTPGWNARDVAMIRNSIDSAHVLLCGYVPSLDVAALIDSKRVRYLNSSSRLDVKAFSSADSSLLPGRIFTNIRASVKSGPVLFVLPRKGYANAVLCAHCKNIAACSCGGKLFLTSKTAQPACRICGQMYSEWKCTYCKRDRTYAISRGIERASEEISRAFSNIPIVLSYGEVIKDSVDAKPSFILSTPGAAPRVEGGYSAVVILEALTYFSHDDLRANERATELFFETAAMVKTGGSVLLSIDETHPIVASLIRWNPATLLKRELKAREEISFPPFVDSAVLEIPTSEAQSLVTGIGRAISEGRLGQNTRVLGPTKLDAHKSKIVVLNEIQSHSGFIAFMHELMRRRSIAKKSDSMLRINPYSL